MQYGSSLAHPYPTDKNTFKVSPELLEKSKQKEAPKPVSAPTQKPSIDKVEKVEKNGK